MVDRFEIGRLLQGFSAGVAGKGPEFLGELSKGRQNAMLQDAFLFERAMLAGEHERGLKILKQREKLVLRLGGDPSDVQATIAKMDAKDFEGATRDASSLVRFAQSKGLLKVPEGETALDKARREKLEREAADAEKPLEVPKSLGGDLSAPTRRQAEEAFRLAGGGKDGVKAFNAQAVLANTTAQRADIPGLLDASYPNATPQERVQLVAAVESGKTVESGLKRADLIRTEQRRNTKGLAFQKRAITLLTKIIDNSELGDVVGSIEGIFDIRLQDSESELIADIEEAQNILTVENMDLMKGVLSEGDLRVLKNLSSGALNRKRTLGRFEEDATTLRDTLQLAQFPSVGAVPTPVSGGAAPGAAPAPSAAPGAVKFLGFEP